MGYSYLFCHLASDIIMVDDPKDPYLRCEICEGDCEIDPKVVLDCLREDLKRHMEQRTID